MSLPLRCTAIFVACALALLAGCGKKETEARNVFRYALVTRPTHLDPAQVQDGDTIDMLIQVFEGLVKWSPESKLVPNLAERWDVLEGGTLYRFYIKKGVTFHNGDRLTAQDFVYSLDRACSAEIKSGTAINYLFDIVGAKDRWDGSSDPLAGVSAPEPYVLEIRIDAPKAYFLPKLTYPTAYAVNRRAIEEAGGGPITRMSAVVGTGPFRMTEYNDSRVALTAYDDYHGGRPHVDGIERPIVINAQTRMNLYEKGRVDLLQMDKQELRAARQDARFRDQIRAFERPAVYYIGMNMAQVPAFRDKRVRQAFALALDKDEIIRGAMHDEVARADCIVPPGVPAHDPSLRMYQHNVQKARELLADAGYPGGKGFPNLNFHFREGRPDVRMVAEVVQQQLKHNLGIETELRPLEWGAYLEAYNNKSLELFHMRWMADYLDPQDFLSVMLTTDGGENKIGYSNPEFDRLCALADVEQHPEKRVELYLGAQKIVVGDAPWIPIYYQRDHELIRPYVADLQDSLLGHLPHVETRLERE
jgi:oligopeptide transport system substrate-binding protein